jgi:hypothetical protein
MTRIVLCMLLLSMAPSGYSQTELSATLAGGNAEGTFSVLFGKDWGIGKRNKRFGVGTGVRFTAYAGANKYYRTAPAELTSGKTGPFVIFAQDIEANMDTFLIKSPQVNSFNIFINLRYKFSEKITAGFNIDAIGFSFGSSKRGNYINGAEGAMTDARPSSFNLLLTSDNDLGSLNSELYGKYFFKSKWAIKVAGQFHFTEYTTDVKVQQEPKPNNRFRNKSLMGSVGIVYQLK